jgi:hypothetical protein
MMSPEPNTSQTGNEEGDRGAAIEEMRQKIQEAFDDVEAGRVMSHDEFFTDLKAFAQTLHS